MVEGRPGAAANQLIAPELSGAKVRAAGSRQPERPKNTTAKFGRVIAITARLLRVIE